MDKQAILNGTYFTLVDNSSRKFQLKFENWNDYGYYTLYGLWLILADTTLRIADVRIFNYSQKFGDKPVWFSSPNVYISNVESAEKLLLFLSYEERTALIKELYIKFDTNLVETENAFLKSVLRDKTLKDFKSQQETIKSLLTSKIEVSNMVLSNLSQIKMLSNE